MEGYLRYEQKHKTDLMNAVRAIERHGNLQSCNWEASWRRWHWAGVKVGTWIWVNKGRCVCNIVQLNSVAQLCPTLCDPTDCSTPGLPVHQQLPEFTQTHVHCVSDAIQPSHPLSSPSPPSFSLSQHQGLFKWVSSSHQVVQVLNCQLQHQSFRIDWLDLLVDQGTLKSLF